MGVPATGFDLEQRILHKRYFEFEELNHTYRVLQPYQERGEIVDRQFAETTLLDLVFDCAIHGIDINTDLIEDYQLELSYEGEVVGWAIETHHMEMGGIIDWIDV